MIYLLALLIIEVAYVAWRIEKCIERHADRQVHEAARLSEMVASHMPLREHINRHVEDLAAAIEAGTQATKEQAAQSRVVHHVKL